MFYVGANVDPKRDIGITDGPLDHLDHAPTLQFIGGKIGIDATAKGPLEGAREWPPEIEMDAGTKALVDRRWDEYGLDGVGRENGVVAGMAQIKRLGRIGRRT
jgi:4-hydroxy-3-polyprenylbenzoate decarboxylase